MDSLTSYLRNLLSYPDERLKKLYQLAKEEKFPVVEPEVGNLLYFFTKLLKPKLVVEFGSGFGYSALWIALACDKGCTIHCIDYQERNRQRALELFSQFELKAEIVYHIGEALTVFNDLSFEDGSLDLVVFDHEKQNYSESLELVLPKLKRGGLIIADDVLWRGEVASKSSKSLKVNALRFFLKEIFHREELSSFVCPLGDGVAVIQKLF
ncbi:MAG: hypothetical protein DSZ31_00605 [Gammaproteobacteria bacterium]|nr:MAG: hypothetical protein DSZ31_00605 [Gammaproteobacteria bacterium]RTZ67065.1 MAG: hypothetical protein DSZ30_06145 [Aquificaceae bacterium]